MNCFRHDASRGSAAAHARKRESFIEASGLFFPNNSARVMLGWLSSNPRGFFLVK